MGGSLPRAAALARIMRLVLPCAVLMLVLGGCVAEGPLRLSAPLRLTAPRPLPLPPPPPPPIPVAAPVIEPGGLPPGWYVPDPPAEPEEPAAPPAVPPDPTVRLTSLLRQNPWLARFWSELTPAEQTRVTRALARGGRAGAAPATWDPMGLQDRVELVFGPLRAAYPLPPGEGGRGAAG